MPAIDEHKDVLIQRFTLGVQQLACQRLAIFFTQKTHQRGDIGRTIDGAAVCSRLIDELRLCYLLGASSSSLAFRSVVAAGSPQIAQSGRARIRIR